MGSTRRIVLKTGAAATAIAAAPQLFAQQSGKRGTAVSFYQKGPVRIRFEEHGSGFPKNDDSDRRIGKYGLEDSQAGLSHPLLR